VGPVTAPRTALVTGASGGIGAAAARALAADGHQVAIGYRSGEAAAAAVLAAIADERGTAQIVRLDVTDPASVDDAATEVERTFGPITTVVNCAGVTDDGLFLRMDADRWRGVLATNLDGAFHVTHRTARAMVRARWGRIVNVASVVALLGSPGQANYAAAKAGLIGLTRSLARELGARNITANVVAPGPIDTDMLAAAGGARVEDLVTQVPTGRIGRPEEVAAAIAFLCSDRAAYINGAVLPVDGGLGMGH
jgi:3-oxoacyl-[acyl-carrier protein] reductase